MWLLFFPYIFNILSLFHTFSILIIMFLRSFFSVPFYLVFHMHFYLDRPLFRLEKVPYMVLLKIFSGFVLSLFCLFIGLVFS